MKKDFEYLQIIYTAKTRTSGIGLHFAAYSILYVYVPSFPCNRAQNMRAFMYRVTQRVMTIQGHSRSSPLVLIEVHMRLSISVQ